jgi:hypothetical protein
MLRRRVEFPSELFEWDMAVRSTGLITSRALRASLAQGFGSTQRTSLSSGSSAPGALSDLESCRTLAVKICSAKAMLRD